MLTLHCTEHLITSSPMSITLSRLTEEFTRIEDAAIDPGSIKELEITSDVKIYSIDISNHISSWYNLDSPNYGLIVRPSKIGTAPDYLVIEPSDSLSILYTTLPEVE